MDVGFLFVNNLYMTMDAICVRVDCDHKYD